MTRIKRVVAGILSHVRRVWGREGGGTFDEGCDCEIIDGIVVDMCANHRARIAITGKYER